MGVVAARGADSEILAVGAVAASAPVAVASEEFTARFGLVGGSLLGVAEGGGAVFCRTLLGAVIELPMVSGDGSRVALPVTGESGAKRSICAICGSGTTCGAWAL